MVWEEPVSQKQRAWDKWSDQNWLGVSFFILKQKGKKNKDNFAGGLWGKEESDGKLEAMGTFVNGKQTHSGEGGEGENNWECRSRKKQIQIFLGQIMFPEPARQLCQAHEEASVSLQGQHLLGLFSWVVPIFNVRFYIRDEFTYLFIHIWVHLKKEWFKESQKLRSAL